MKTTEPIFRDPTNDDTIDMEIPPSDNTSNIIVLGCLCGLILFAIAGAMSCVLVMAGVLNFN